MFSKEEGRKFMKASNEAEEIVSDQMLKLPQPPLVKAKTSDKVIELPLNFEDLEINNDLMSVFYGRESHRVYQETPVSLLQLSFLLWASQGVKSIRGNNYATLRTVPSGGARHPFETYLIVDRVEGLEKGVYHYLPLENSIELLKEDDCSGYIGELLLGQNWANKAAVTFVWSFTPYRCEWRYSNFSYKPALLDLGHVGQNLYLACESVGLGTCGIASYDQKKMDEYLNLDGEEEHACYVSTVGVVSKSDKEKELAFYSFLKEDK